MWLLLLAYALGLLMGELGEMERDLGVYGHMRKYIKDHFNVLDLLSIITLASLVVARFLVATYDSVAALKLCAPSQALCALFVWLRLLQATSMPRHSTLEHFGA